MKYADMKAHLEAVEAACKPHHDALREINDERFFKIRDDHRRQWLLAPGLLLRFDVGTITYDGGLRFEGSDFGVPPNLTRQGLLNAAAAVQHVEAWLAGSIDELIPSGPWPGNGTSS